jgi:imidazolonepropionase-like amidohydrolase
MRYVPDPVLAQWAQQAGGLAQAGFTPENGADFIRLRRRIVAALHRAGVPLMAGSDTAQAFHLWGPGLLAEVEALQAAGLSNMEARRSATVVPRDYFRSLPNGGSALGWRADFGTVEAGARADLILLRGDPSRDLAALHRLDTVIAAGRVHDRAALDHMLDEASRAAKAQH